MFQGFGGILQVDGCAGYNRPIRPIALTRKNGLFAGHDAGAENGAVITSFIEICKMNAADPHAWLTATLSAIVRGHKQSQIDNLFPWNYAVTVRSGQRLHSSMLQT